MDISYFIPANPLDKLPLDSSLKKIHVDEIEKYINENFKSPKTIKLDKTVLNCQYYVFDQKPGILDFNDLAMDIMGTRFDEDEIMGNILLHNNDSILNK